jgi:hypothetical protein
VAVEKCSVQGCGQPIKRSLPTRQVKEALPTLKIDGEARRTFLCRDHYREFKKKTKGQRELERLGW